MSRPATCFIIVAVMIAPLVGCAKTQHYFGPNLRRGRVPIDATGVANAKDSPEPEINANTHFAAGRHYFEPAGRFQEAIEQYRKAVAKNPDYVEAYNRIGVLLGYLGKHAEAEQALRRAVELRPESGALRNNLGFQYILARRWADAERELRRSVELDPGFVRARVNLGVSLAAQARFEDALHEYRRVLADADAYYNVALAYRAHRRYDEARVSFEHVLSLDPHFEAARKQLDHLPEPSDDAQANAELPDAEPPFVTLVDSDAPEQPAVAPEAQQPDGTTLADVDWKDLRDSLGTIAEQVELAFASLPGDWETTPESPPAYAEPIQPNRPTPTEESEISPDADPDPEPAAAAPVSPVEDGREAPAPADFSPLTCAGDFDGDGAVTIRDLPHFFACFTQDDACPVDWCDSGDFDDDGDVDLADYRAMQRELGTP